LLCKLDCDVLHQRPSQLRAKSRLRRVSALGPLSSALRAALRAVALSHARLRVGVTRARLSPAGRGGCPKGRRRGGRALPKRQRGWGREYEILFFSPSVICCANDTSLVRGRQGPSGVIPVTCYLLPVTSHSATNNASAIRASSHTGHRRRWRHPAYSADTPCCGTRRRCRCRTHLPAAPRRG